MVEKLIFGYTNLKLVKYYLLSLSFADKAFVTLIWMGWGVRVTLVKCRGGKTQVETLLTGLIRVSVGQSGYCLGLPFCHRPINSQ